MNNSIKNQINRSNVMTSTFIIPLAVPLFLAFLTAWQGGPGMGFLALLFFGMIIGAVFYIPSIIGALLIEAIIINAGSTKITVAWTLVIEGLIAFLAIGFALEFFSYDPSMLFPLVMSIAIPQLLRWFYLKARNRMYLKEFKTQVSDILDDIEIEDNVEH